MSTIPSDRLQEAKDAGLNNPEAENAWKCFCYIDEDGSGAIDESELRYAMQLQGCDLSENSVKKLLSESDSDGNGQLSFKEYCGMVKRKMKAKSEREKKLRDAFQKFDADDSGLIDPQELKDALTSMGLEPLTDSEMDDLLKLADADKDGKLSVDEFIRILTMDLEDMIQRQ